MCRVRRQATDKMGAEAVADWEDKVADREEAPAEARRGAVVHREAAECLGDADD